LSIFTDALNAGVSADVLNNSWGFSDHFSDNFTNAAYTDYAAALQNLAQNGRGGLGTITVFSSGNNRTGGADANYHNSGNSPYTISVAAMDSDGTYSSFSNPGANVLITAPGSSLYTTDKTGINGYSAGDYSYFSGTSGSAPIVSGVAALILEANSTLGYRDVQEIMAYSAAHNDPGASSWQYNGAGNWNGGGLHFSHDYGFGLIDARAAVRLAESWEGQQTFSNMTSVSASASPALSLGSTGTWQTTINVASNIEIEHVQITLDLAHTHAGDLIVKLISPDGTQSVLMNQPDNGNYASDINFTFSSVAHLGEFSQGTWTLRVEDSVSGNSGTLNSWDLTFLGNTVDTNDVYIFTDSFADFSGAELTARSTLNDVNGGTDTLNLAAVTTSSTVDLGAGTANIATHTVSISGIEKVYGGDANDTLTGDGSDNEIYGGRGDDTLMGAAGDDLLDGQQGNDTVNFLALVDDFTFNFVDAITVTANHIAGTLGFDTLKNFELFNFNDGLFTRQELEDYVANGGSTNDFAPVTSVGDLTLNIDESVLASTAIGATDADGNELTYTVFSRLRIVGGDVSGDDTLWLKASDGTYSTSWAKFFLTTSSGGGTNDFAPVTSVSDFTLSIDQSVLASTVIGATDADGNTLSYTVWDGTSSAASGYFDLDGVRLSAGTGHTLTADEFSRLLVVGGDQDGSDTMWLRASDGTNTTSWDKFFLTTSGSGAGGAGAGGTNDFAPVTSVSDFNLNIDESILASTVIGATDADGNALTYVVWDGTSSAASGYFDLDGVRLSAGIGHTLTADEFSRLRIVGGDQDGTDTMWLKASDDTYSTSWAKFFLTTSGGAGGANDFAPVTSVSDFTLNVDESILASTVIGATDADGNELSYAVWDSTGTASSGYFELDGVRLSAGTGHTLTADEFSRLRIIGGDNGGTDTMWLRSSDGVHTTSWAKFFLTTTDIGGTSTDTVTIQSEDVIDFGSPYDEALTSLYDSAPPETMDATSEDSVLYPPVSETYEEILPPGAII
jgi:subtilisin-like proprotein convertase family protein